MGLVLFWFVEWFICDFGVSDFGVSVKKARRVSGFGLFCLFFVDLFGNCFWVILLGFNLAFCFFAWGLVWLFVVLGFGWFSPCFLCF